MTGDGDEIRLGAVQPTLDQVQSFHVETLDVRGRVVRLGGVLDAVLGDHGYPAPITRLLAEALTLTALIGSTLVEEGAQATLQARGDGPANLLVCDYMAPGAVRGYVGFDLARAGDIEPAAPIHDLLGEGYLALTIDQPGIADGRYQGIVSLEGATLAQVVQRYFISSEQLPTWVRLEVLHDPLARRWYAGGMLLQHLPRGEEGGERLFVQDETPPNWRHATLIADTIRPEELTDPSVSFETLLWRLFHEEQVRLLPPAPLHRGCRCSRERIQAVLRQFSMDELMDMREPDGSFRVNCRFCSKDWVIERPQERL